MTAADRAALSHAEFIVAGPRGYVAEVDPCDGEVDWTSTPYMARIFRGAAWRDVWEGREYTLLPVPEDE